MKVQICITLSDQTTEKELNAAGFTIEQLCKTYERAYIDFISEAIEEGLEFDVHATATDNTKEVQNPESLWEHILNNYKAGLYGEPEKIETQLRYWKEMHVAGYPNANENVKYLESCLESLEALHSSEREARWKGAGMGDYYCSLCNNQISGRTKFCPECGAKMDEWEEGANDAN